MKQLCRFVLVMHFASFLQITFLEMMQTVCFFFFLINYFFLFCSSLFLLSFIFFSFHTTKKKSRNQNNKPHNLCESTECTNLKIKRDLFILLNYCMAEVTPSMSQPLPVYHHSCSVCFSHIISLGLGHHCGSAGTQPCSYSE